VVMLLLKLDKDENAPDNEFRAVLDNESRDEVKSLKSDEQ
jgi:hypothetical protein